MDQLPEPSAGDCWYCHMVTDENKPLGDVVADNEHIRSHVEEGYLHGSLILRALQWAGYRDVGFIWQMENRNRAAGRKTDWAKRALRRYLRQKLQLAT